jgi:hypothetical protein
MQKKTKGSTQTGNIPRGHKRIKGVPELHDELKTRVNFSLTPTGVDGLDGLAAERGLSRSELVERIGRGQIRLVDYSHSIGATTSEFADELTMSAIKSEPFNQCHNLPSCPGAYLVANFTNHIHAGHDANLKKRFADDRFLERLKKLFKNDYNERLDLYWVECSDVKALPDIERVLVAVFQKVVGESVFRQRMARLSQQK